MRLNSKKRDLGQFFTKKDKWLKPQVVSFIKEANRNSVLDPFAGDGDILKAIAGINEWDNLCGLDIDNELNWELNDSLISIPKTDSIIITNPPYYAKNCANVNQSKSYKYFKDSEFDNLYQIALEKCLNASDYVVSIVPESFLLANVLLDRLQSITILEENPFDDTTFPVCVVCYGDTQTSLEEIKIYKGDKYCSTFKELISQDLKPQGWLKVKFNYIDGNIGIRCIDGVGVDDNIRFCLPVELDYDISKINKNSRFITVAQIDTDVDIELIIKKANEILNDYRVRTNDLLMLAFRSNKKNGVRRRRVDFKTVRAILEQSITSIKGVDMIE